MLYIYEIMFHVWERTNPLQEMPTWLLANKSNERTTTEDI